MTSSKSIIQISLKENIKVTTGYYLYSGLSLLAEIGGFIGLGQLLPGHFRFSKFCRLRQKKVVQVVFLTRYLQQREEGF